jgi:hypothetical protein
MEVEIMRVRASELLVELMDAQKAEYQPPRYDSTYRLGRDTVFCPVTVEDTPGTAFANADTQESPE